MAVTVVDTLPQRRQAVHVKRGGAAEAGRRNQVAEKAHLWSTGFAVDDVNACSWQAGSSSGNSRLSAGDQLQPGRQLFSRSGFHLPFMSAWQNQSRSRWQQQFQMSNAASVRDLYTHQKRGVCVLQAGRVLRHDPSERLTVQEVQVSRSLWGLEQLLAGTFKPR